LLKLKSVTPAKSIKNGSFETLVLAVVSIVKAVGAESALPSYMFTDGVTTSDLNSSSSNESKTKGKKEETSQMDSDHKKLLSTVVLNWTDPEVDWIPFSDISPTDPYIRTKMIDAVRRTHIKKGAQPVQDSRTEMYAKQRDGETCIDVWQLIKRNAQGLRSA
jgi:hypothetical protein